MENIFAQPSVFVTSEAQKYKPPKNLKPLLLILLVIIILVLGLTGFYYRNYLQKNATEISSKLGLNKVLVFLNTNLKAQSTIIGKGKISDLATKDLPSLFYADLEYNLKTGSVTQIQTGETKGEPQGLIKEKPKENLNDKFIYEVEIISKNNEILQTGWGVDYKEIIQQADGKFRFKVTVPYYSNSRVRVLLNNKSIWIGFMPVSQQDKP